MSEDVKMNELRECATAQEVRDNYRAVRMRMSAPPPLKLPVAPVLHPAPDPEQPRQRALIEILADAPRPLTDPLRLLPIGIRAVQIAVAAAYDIPVDGMTSKRRARSIARPRQVAMFLCHEVLHKSLPEVGRRFGGKDHTTVLHACRKIRALCAKDPVLAAKVAELTLSLKE